MSPRAFLVRGLLVGLLTGFAAFVVAYTAGEPHVQAAIDLEEASAAVEDPHSHDAGEAGHHHEEDGAVVSRDNQRTWGLLTATLGVSTALGGLVGLVSAGAVGRLGRLRPGQSTALVALLGFVSVSLVPFLKYPAAPPAVGSADTIGARTGDYFIFVSITVLAAIAGTLLANRLQPKHGAYRAVLAGAGVFLVVVIAAGVLMPTVNEVGDFPADTLWYFRRASLLTMATMWAGIGVGMTGLIGRLHRQTAATLQRRELAASL